MPSKHRRTANEIGSGDASTIRATAEVLSGKSKKGFIHRLLPFLGPAFIASVTYIDPGNFATNIQAGASFGYVLLWVIVVSNLMAMLIQMLSAKLGIATGHNLAELCRDHYSRPVVWGMWVLAEIVVIATDLAEFLGAALGFQLLLHIPLLLGGIITSVVTFAILGLERYGFRLVEAVITAMVGVIAFCYLIETFLVRPALEKSHIMLLFHNLAALKVFYWCQESSARRSCRMLYSCTGLSCKGELSLALHVC